MKKLEIILRTCDVRNVHQDWRVRYCGLPKNVLLLGCTNSLINACRGIPGIKLVILDDHSSQNTIDSLRQLLSTSDLSYELINLEGEGYNNSAYHQFLRCRDSEYEFVYSVEDDYLHCSSAIREMLDSYEFFSERLNDKLISLYPFDAPEEYNPPKVDFIVRGSARHWRTTTGCTNTIFSKPQLFRDHWDLFETLALKYNGNYLEPRVEHYDESNTIQQIWKNGLAVMFNPIPSLALHMQFEQQRDPFINWYQWWENYAKINPQE